MQPDPAEPYASLRPFETLFQTGLPALMYHKLGPRPPGTRLKGLYVPARRFARQLAELKRAGFESASFSDWPAAATPAKKRIVITFDDGFCNVARHGLEPLAGVGFRAIQFLVADRLGGQNDWDLPAGEAPERLMDLAQVKEWMQAGHEVGSHTLSHPQLTQLPLEKAREEITASKRKLEDWLGVEVAHFCYPYGDWNPAVRDLVAEAGYRTACTTQPGINLPRTNPFELRRITARYPSRNLKAMWRRLRARCRPAR